MRPLYLITLLLSSFNFSLHGNWIQVGQELVGTASEEYFGENVKLSSDGLTLMGMSADSNFGGEQTGLVRTYNFNGTDWDIQQNITGEEYSPITYADLSHSGDTIITYSYYTNRMKPYGSNYLNMFFGINVISYAINGNATKVMYGLSDGTLEYFRSGGMSHQLGNFGQIKSISLTKSGNHVAFGNASNEVYVFEFNGNWNQKGNTITGNVDFGENVALNDDGTIVAVGAPYDDINDGDSSGLVKVYQYSSSLNDWIQMGQTITGDNPGDKCGEAVAINEQGNIIAVGYEDHDGNGEDSGLVRVFQFNESSWEQIGQDIYGEAAYDYFGESIGMNAEGTRIAISSQDNDSNGTDAGHIRVFDFIPNQEPIVTPVYELKIFKSTDMNIWDLIETRDMEASEEDLFIKAELSPKASN